MMSWFIKSFFSGALLTVGLAITGAGQASAAMISGTLTADNHYGLFTGNEDGSMLNFIGRNEKGSAGSSGGFNWSQAETWEFNINPGEYLYSVVWDDAAVAESWIGEFNLEDGTQLLSDASKWEYVVSKGKNPGDNGDVPMISELNSEIKNANWTGSSALGKNGINPWGFIQGISADASFLNVSNSSSMNYTIFRTKNAVVAKDVPEPISTSALLAFGVLSAGSFLKRKTKEI
jgi:hypothetical protein